jgi:hypothetical protein
MSMIVFTSIYLTLAFIAQAPGGSQTAAGATDERLKFMQDSIRNYELTLGGGHEAVPKLQEKPVFRLGKQSADNVEDGAIFLWTVEDGRPEAAVQVFQIKDAGVPKGLWIHEFTSLAPTTITAVRNGQIWWAPKVPGVEFKPLPGAPRPAESASQRGRQMRALAAGFRASDNFKAKGWSELRLLPTPVTRYGGPGTKVVDGALFALVLATDPEVFLFLEARSGPQGLQWEYALAPMTAFALKGYYQGKAVWEMPDRMLPRDPSKPLFSRDYEP